MGEGEEGSIFQADVLAGLVGGPVGEGEVGGEGDGFGVPSGIVFFDAGLVVGAPVDEAGPVAVVGAGVAGEGAPGGEEVGFGFLEIFRHFSEAGKGGAPGFAAVADFGQFFEFVPGGSALLVDPF